MSAFDDLIKIIENDPVCRAHTHRVFREAVEEVNGYRSEIEHLRRIKEVARFIVNNKSNFIHRDVDGVQSAAIDALADALEGER